MSCACRPARAHWFGNAGATWPSCASRCGRRSAWRSCWRRACSVRPPRTRGGRRLVGLALIPLDFRSELGVPYVPARLVTAVLSRWPGSEHCLAREPTASLPPRRSGPRSSRQFVSELRIARARPTRVATDGRRYRSRRAARRCSASASVCLRSTPSVSTPAPSLDRLLTYPFQLLRLGAYWNRLEPGPDRFVTGRARPADRCRRARWQARPARPRRGEELWLSRVLRADPPAVATDPRGRAGARRRPRLAARPALEHLARLVERYRDRACIVGWQIEHESVDPLGLEHSWRLAADFVKAELGAVRRADPSRPILLNGFLPMSIPVAAQQWWRTRDQGDSLAFALDHADIVGLDVTRGMGW